MKNLQIYRKLKLKKNPLLYQSKKKIHSSGEVKAAYTSKYFTDNITALSKNICQKSAFCFSALHPGGKDLPMAILVFFLLFWGPIIPPLSAKIHYRDVFVLIFFFFLVFPDLLHPRRRLTTVALSLNIHPSSGFITVI